MNYSVDWDGPGEQDRYVGAIDYAPQCSECCQYAVDVGVWPTHQCFRRCMYLDHPDNQQPDRPGSDEYEDAQRRKDGEADR